MTVVIIQCRLSSTRLPGKALMNLGGVCTVEWTLSAMKKIKADRYFLACDIDSEKALRPLAEKNGFELYAGDRDDVLKRFCDVIELTGADIVVRATADNPFLFYEAAQECLEEFYSLPDYDYMTYTGLPHGSGVEVFNGKSLLKARTLTELPYDHEHVGPALYNHPENFKSYFKKAPERFYYPEYRTTIDTYSDYKRALSICDYVSSGKVSEPYTTEQTVQAMKETYIKNQILLVPSVRKGRGTGHLRRELELALNLKAFLYVPSDGNLSETEGLLEEYRKKGLKEFQLIRDFSLEDMVKHSVKWNLVVSDLFSQTMEEAEALSELGPLVSIDEGSQFHQYSDFLLDIIPSGNLHRKANLVSPSCIPLPENCRKSFPSAIHKVLVCFGGENHEALVYKTALAFAEAGTSVTAVSGSFEKLKARLLNENKGKTFPLTVDFIPPVEGLREKLFDYDLVVTHYGFTAFEAVKADCAVILMGVSPLHSRLSKQYGFFLLEEKNINSGKIKKLISEPEKLTSRFFRQEFASRKDNSLLSVIKGFDSSMKISCPVCGNVSPKPDRIKARTTAHTFRRCSSCNIIYLGFSTDSNVQYEKSYFDSEYKNQYGRTYLDDFDFIKTQGLRRVEEINRVLGNKKGNLLDVGCAYGPFLSAAEDSGWTVYGSDISADAIDYVKNELKYSAVNASFTDFDPVREFGIKEFDAVTMWYVIEHVKDLKTVLTDINHKLKTGGIFSFSTPSGSGISARCNTESFFIQSPKDHYTIWEIENTKKILKRFGFKVEKIVSTGIHPERHPLVKKLGIHKGNLLFSIAEFLCRLFKAGDTYEVYCTKQENI